MAWRGARRVESSRGSWVLLNLYMHDIALRPAGGVRGVYCLIHCSPPQESELKESAGMGWPVLDNYNWENGLIT